MNTEQIVQCHWMTPSAGVAPDLDFFMGEGEEREFGGRKYRPDMSRGYTLFRLSHSYPVVTSYGTALAPKTVERSWSSLEHQVFNLEHRMKAYHPNGDKMKGDSILGSVLSVRLVQSGGRAHIEGIAAYAKMAHRMGDVLAQHLGGRHRWTVSMEVSYRMSESSWLVGTPGGNVDDVVQAVPDLASFATATPDDWRKQGLVAVPHPNAPQDLLECWSPTEHRVMKQYGNQPTCLLMGGVDGRVHYSGVGLVPYGAEPTAEVSSMLAEHPILRQLDDMIARFRNS